MRKPVPRSRFQRGISLVEALVGFLILSLGALGATRLQSTMRLNADLARQRTEALQLAQTSMEALRTTARAEAPSSTRGATATFSVSQDLSEAHPGTAQAAVVTVRWADRSGAVQSLALDSLLAGDSPTYSALLTLASQDPGVAPARQLPWGTRPFRGGRSVFKPDTQGTQAWLFSPATGEVSTVCSAPAATPATALTESDLTHCDAVQATLLSGFVRFSLGATPDAEHPNDVPLPLSVELALQPSAASPALCHVQVHSGDGQAERYSAYACVVPLSSAQSGWSGRLGVVPQGWVLGNDAASRKVCRYSADLDGSGRIDLNSEHPAAYERVIGPLLQQNYLVIRGDGACPAALQSHNVASADTVQHQP